MKLHRLSAEAHSLVTKDLASGALPRHAPVTCSRFLEDPERALDLAALDDAVDALLARTAPRDPAMDATAAAAIHRALPLRRREASHPGVWRFLTVVHRPDFVRHRWEDRAWATTRSRFWSPGTRPDSNAFCRLWWIAELTRDGDSYALTERAFARQSLATPLFVRGFSQVPAASRAFVLELELAPAATIERVARELSGVLSTVVLEALDTDAIREIQARQRNGAR